MTGVISAASSALAEVPRVSATNNAIAWVGAAVVLLLLSRVLHDRSFRYLAAMLSLFALARVLFSLTHPPSVVILVGNLLVIASAWSEICFFRTVLHDDTHSPPPRLRNELMVAAIVATIAISTWLLAPEAGRGGALAGTGYAHNLPSFIFVTTIIGYYVTVSARVVHWTRALLATWFADRGDSDISPPGAGSRRNIARAGFRAGIVILAASELLRLLADIVKLSNEIVARTAPTELGATQRLSPIIEACIRTGHTTFYLGALLPILADTAASVPFLYNHARNYALLEPLWRAVTQEFPDLAFRAGRSVHTRFYRREIEIRDAIVMLGPFYDRDVAAEAEPDHAGQPGVDRNIAVTVALIRAALRDHRLGERIPDPHPLPTSGAGNRPDDIAWMLRVAVAFTAAEKAVPHPTGT